MGGIEERLRAVEDQLAIADLRGRYCHLLDGRQWPAFIDLFTEDGVFEGLSAVRGRAALTEFFAHRVPAMTEEFWHFCSNGTAVLDGERATGRISMEYLSVMNGVSYVSAGHYDDEMVKRDGVWRFAARRLTFYFLAPLHEGWAGRPFHNPASSISQKSSEGAGN